MYMCWRTVWWCLPGPAPPPLRADCAAADDDNDGYEELPVSLPPHVPRGLSRDDGAPSAGGEEPTTTFAVEQVVVAPPSNAGFGIGGGAWLALVCASSVCAKVAAGLSQS